MSQENVDLVHRAYAAIHRRDLDAYVALHDSACQISPRIVSIEGGAPYRGHEGVRAFWTDVQTSFTDWLPELGEVVEQLSASHHQSLTPTFHSNGE